jgi:hypothetical protein
MEFKFIDKEVAEQFETDFLKDPMVRVPRHHLGKLSKINLQTAEALISMGSNLVRRKEGTPASETGKKSGKEKSHSVS